MTATASSNGPDGGRRVAAIGALLLGIAAVVVAAVSLAGDVWRAVLSPILVLLVVGLAWSALTRRGPMRVAGWVLAAVAIAGLVVVVLGVENRGFRLIVVLGLAALSVVCSQIALRPEVASLAEIRPGSPSVRRNMAH